MKIFKFAGWTISLSVAAAMLTACALQAPISAPRIPQARGAHVTQKTSSGELIYSSNAYAGNVTMYTYPGGPSVGSISARGAEGECAGSAGHVFVAATTGTQDNYTGDVYEFAYGGLITTLANPHWSAGTCAIDPKTGDLAVPGYKWPSDTPGVVFYRHAKGKRSVLFITNQCGTGTKYAGCYPVGFCTYDTAGNLYLAVNSNKGTGLLRLPAGSKTFELMSTDISITRSSYDPPTVQWADDHLIVSTYHYDPSELYLYELSVKGNTATTVHTTTLHTLKYRDHFLHQTWVQGNTVLAYVASARGLYTHGRIATWAYPRGGLPRDNINIDAYGAYGLAVGPRQ